MRGNPAVIILALLVVKLKKAKVELFLYLINIAPPFLISALYGGEWSVSRPGSFTPGLKAPLDRRPGGSQSRSWRCGEEKNLLPLPSSP
jgi:hypothetical protein